MPVLFRGRDSRGSSDPQFKPFSKETNYPMTRNFLRRVVSSGTIAIHDPANNNCPINADPRNESCGCGIETVRINPETGTRYSRAELTAAFNRVANLRNWKMPIDTIIPGDDADVVEQAIIFFTGSVPQFRPHPDNSLYLIVKADGYYAVIGA
jgi:hypothetical protein